jgi:putative PIN family toxin of toxin-antitoxin system
MRVVFDTNVYVSALFWEGPPKSLIAKAINGSIELIVSEPILAELSNVISSSFRLSTQEAEHILRMIRRTAKVVESRASIWMSRGTKQTTGCWNARSRDRAAI